MRLGGAIRRLFVAGGVAAMSVSAGPTGPVVADGWPDATFGVDGVTVDSAVLNGGALARVHDVIDDHEGRLLVAGSYWASSSGSAGSVLLPVPPLTQFIARYDQFGQLDPTFGSGGVVRETPLGGSEPQIGLAMLPDGSVLVTTGPSGGPTRNPWQGLHLSDSGHPLAPFGVGSDAGPPVELPDGRVAFSVPPFGYSGDRAQFIQVLLPDGTVDRGFDGTVGSDVVAASALPLIQSGAVVAGADGSLLGALAASSGLCRVVRFLPSGGLDPSFGLIGAVSVPTFGGRCTLLRDADGAGLLQTNMPNQFHEVTSRIDRSGTVTPVAWPFVGPAAVEGWGRRIGVVAANPTLIGAAFGDGTLDDTFGDAGVVQFPGDFRGLRVLDHGGVIAYGFNNSGNAIVLQRLDTYFGTAPEPPVLPTAKFVPVPPQRVLDTRLGLGAPLGKVAAGGTLDLALGGVANVPATGVVAVALNVTATESAGPGFVTVYPTGRSRPVVSSLNLERADQTVANQVTARVGTGTRVSLFTHSATHLVADVAGYYVEAEFAAEGRFLSVPPERLLDTRSGVGATARIVPAGGQIRLQARGVWPIPSSGVSAVVLNLTGTEALALGFVTAWPSGGARPVVSNLNLDVGETRANLVVVPLGADGAISLFSSGGTHLIADVAGWFTDSTAEDDSAGLLVALDSPVRMLDTRLRQPSAMSAGESFRLRIGSTTTVPTFGYADSVLGNVTMTSTRGPGFLTLWPGASAQPFASSVNASRAGQTVPNAVVVKLGDDMIRGYLSAGAHVIIDVTGWYTAY